MIPRLTLKAKKITFEETTIPILMATIPHIYASTCRAGNVRVLVLAGLLFCLSSCDSCKTKPDFKDKTAPTVTWILTHASGVKDSINGAGTSVINMGEAVHVLAVLKDDGGIVEVTTSRATGYDCLGDVLQSPSFGPFEQTIPVSLDANGEALKMFPVAFDVNTLLICPQGLEFQQGSITLKCSGLNFGNLKTEGVLSIHVNKRF